MTSKEFILWLKGFTEGAHEFNITPKQWDLLKDKLVEVDDNEPIINTPNTAPIQTLHFIDPYHPYKVTHAPDTNGNTTTYSGITFSGSYNPSTTTAFGYPSGSAWSYTNSTNVNPIQREEHPQKYHNED